MNPEEELAEMNLEANPTEEYLDQEDLTDQQERMEDQGDDIESAEWADTPQRRKQESLYTLFQKVLKSPDSTKLANLNNQELGRQPLMTVRDAQYLALLGITLKHGRFARFFRDTGEITLATSASKKGWQQELFISQKKSTQRASGMFGQNTSNEKKKWSLFGGGERTSQPDQQPMNE
jgi:hypothetical protein